MRAAGTRPRICFVGGGVFGVSAIGGAERQMYLAAEGLSKRGWETSAVLRQTTEHGPADAWTLGPVFVFSARTGLRLGWSKAISCAATKAAADLYYQRGASVFTVATAAAAKSLHRPFVWAASSDADADSVPGRWMRGYGHRRRVGRGVCRSATAALLEAQLHLRVIRAMRCADLVIAQTDTQARLLHRMLGRKRSIVVVPSIAAEMDPGRDDERALALWVGANKPVKRPGLFSELAAVGPGALDYVAVGLGFDGDDDGVRRPGKLSHDQVIDLMRRSVALVNTSEAEGFPNTFIEAWTVGTPVLTFGIDPDHVISERGLGFVAGSVRDAVGYLEWLVAGGEEVGEVRERCRRYVTDVHGEQKILDRLDSLLRGMLAGGVS